MTWQTLVVVTLAAARLTRLVTTDSITAPARERLARRFASLGSPRWPVVLANCPWCLSVWASLGVLLVSHGLGYGPSWGFGLLAWPAVAFGAGAALNLTGA